MKMHAADVVLPLTEEELEVTKQAAVSERVRVQTVTDTVQELVRQELRGERIEVERVPIDRMIELGAQPQQVRTEGNVTIVPIFEEVLVVEKRLMLREELHIRVQRTETHDRRTVRLRSEDITIDHLDGPAAQAPAPSPQPPGETP